MKFLLSKPRPTILDALLQEQSAQSPSYREVGATASRVLPQGYRHGRQEVELGRGEDIFERASDGLRHWQAHRRAGAIVHPQHPAVAEGSTVVLAIRVAFLWVTVACRVVYVTDQPNRRGFAYGTLPHHVIRGEEAFTVERDETGVVRFIVSAFLKPRGVMSTAGPVVHALDQRLVRRYLRGLQAHMAETM